MNGRESADARGDWLFDGEGEPGESERELMESLRAARWSGDVEGMMRGIDTEAREGEPSVAQGEDRGWRVQRRWLGAAILAAAAVLVVVNVWAFAFRRGGDAVWERAAGGGWAVGEWLRTGAAEHVEVASDIGRVTVGPDSRVRLVRAADDEHRLELAEGSIEAFIYAPPRLFFVDTPAATAVDMGCAYTLDVAADGSGLLRVTGGWVELQGEPVASRVPAGAVCRIFADGGPGLPRFEDAAEDFRVAIERFEEGDGGALVQALAAARPRDSLTLWHLLGRTEGTAREHVANALALLVPAPSAGVEASARTLESAALEDWWSAVRRAW